jgi:signal peptide peptidase SppA
VQQKLKTANISKADLSRLEEAETKYRASIRASQAEMDSALRQFRSHSLDIVTLGDTGDPKALREALRKDVERDGGRFTKALDQQLQAEQLYMAQVSSVLSEGERASLKKFLSKAAPGLAASYLYQEPPVSLAVLAGLPPVNDADASSSPNTATDTRSFADVQLATEPPRMYVLRFDGDAMASQVRRLREEVTAILQQSDPARGDSVVLRLNSSGGTVTGYGLAASQLQRLKQAQLPLTVCVDEVAASGGYMMACVADEICASPFAAVGSIGVVATSPNVYERLKREGVAVTDITAGEFKRTLAPYKEVDERDARKVQQDVVALHRSFQQFVLHQRPGLKDRIAQVATGEVWYGAEAVERGLVDRIRTVDDVLLDRLKAHSRVEILQLQYVGDKIEAREERDQFGRWVGEGAGVADGGLLDQCLGWVGRRLVGHLLSAVSAEGALPPLGGSADHISAAAAGLKSTPPMVRDDRFGY